MHREEYLLLTDFIEWLRDNFSYHQNGLWIDHYANEQYTEAEVIEKYYQDLKEDNF